MNEFTTKSKFVYNKMKSISAIRKFICTSSFDNTHCYVMLRSVSGYGCKLFKFLAVFRIIKTTFDFLGSPTDLRIIRRVHWVSLWCTRTLNIQKNTGHDTEFLMLVGYQL